MRDIADLIQGASRQDNAVRGAGPDAEEAHGRARTGALNVAPEGLVEGASVAALCQDRSGTRSFLLTCGHVFVDVKLAMHVRVDVRDSNGRTITRGRLGQCEPVAPGRTAAIDAALVEIAPETARTLTLAYGGLRPLGIASSASTAGLSLVLQTGRGAIRAVLVGTLAELSVETSSGSHYTLRNAHAFRTAEPSLPGDSGSAVLDESGRLVGIHCGSLRNDPSGRSNAFFCAIGPVVEAFGVRLLTNESASRPIPRPTSATADEKTSADGERELDVVARTIWGEAGDLGEEAMRAVAAVILNRRSHHPGNEWWGKTALEVCLRPYQFRCWDPSSPTIHRMRAMAKDDAALQRAREIAKTALDAGIVPDPTKGATRYHPDWVIPVPVWATGHQPLERIAGLWFYRVD